MRLSPAAQVEAVGVDVLAQQRDLADAVGDERSASATISPASRLRSGPRTYGTMQYEQKLVQPDMIWTQAWNGRSRRAAARR